MTLICPCKPYWNISFNRPKSTSEPASGKYGAPESYIEAVESDIIKLLSKKSSLTKEKKEDIDITKADKGSALVVVSQQTTDGRSLSAFITDTLDERYKNDENGVNVYKTLCSTNC